MRRNVSLPDDLDQAAHDAGISLSEALQSALRQQLDGHQAADAVAVRLDGIERQLRQLVHAAAIVLGVSVGLAVLAGMVTWQARTA